MTHSTGTLAWRAFAWGTVLGKPSRSHCWCPSFANSSVTSPTIIESGTRSPRAMNSLASSPSGDLSLIWDLSRSPLERCTRPKSLTIQALIVPFPDPGAPSINTEDSLQDWAGTAVIQLQHKLGSNAGLWSSFPENEKGASELRIVLHYFHLQISLVYL